MSSEIKTSSLEFGTVIAFVAPGFVGFYAVSCHVSTARAWLDAASNKDQSVGAFLFALLASIAIGLIISGVRQLVMYMRVEAHCFGKNPNAEVATRSRFNFA